VWIKLIDLLFVSIMAVYAMCFFRPFLAQVGPKVDFLSIIEVQQVHHFTEIKISDTVQFSKKLPGFNDIHRICVRKNNRKTIHRSVRCDGLVNRSMTRLSRTCGFFGLPVTICQKKIRTLGSAWKSTWLLWDSSPAGQNIQNWVYGKCFAVRLEFDERIL